MVENEKELFDEVEEEAVVEETENKELQEIEEEVEFGDISDQVKYDVALEEKDKAKVFVIDTVEMKKPVRLDSNGQTIEPISLSPKDPTKLGYTTKLVLTFKDTNYAAIVPTVKWYQSVRTVETDGKKKIIKTFNPWFNTNVKKEGLESNQVAQISKLFYRYCEANGLDMKKTTQKNFLDGLVGQKVKLQTESGNYKGNDWAKLTVTEFIK